MIMQSPLHLCLLILTHQSIVTNSILLVKITELGSEMLSHWRSQGRRARIEEQVFRIQGTLLKVGL